MISKQFILFSILCSSLFAKVEVNLELKNLKLSFNDSNLALYEACFLQAETLKLCVSISITGCYDVKTKICADGLQAEIWNAV